MGYDFTIGEAVPQIASAEDIDSGEDHAALRWKAEPIRDATMPGGWSSRSASYGGWAHVCDVSGLGDLLGQRANGATGPLIPDHPGAARLTPGHLARFREGLAMARRAGDEAPAVEALEWLVAWTEYALAHCTVPTLYNR